MAKLAENDLFNTLICNLIVADMDYKHGKINVQTLEYVYKQTYKLFLLHINLNTLNKEWYNSHVVIGIKLTISEQ